MLIRKVVTMISVVVTYVAFADNGVTNTFNMTTANTPFTAYDYTEPTHWSNAALGAPVGSEAYPTFKVSTTPYFVKLPDGFKTTLITLNKGAFLLGDYLKINSAENKATATGGNADYPYGGLIFGDLKITKLYSAGKSSYMGGLSVAGHIRPGAWDGGVDGDQIYAHTGRVTLRHDLFADSANPVREGAYHYTMPFIESGGFTVYGPKGALANDSSWNLTAGEVYAEYAGAGDHAVVPGQVVAGTGVQPDTFVRYVFPGTKWIALSAPATATTSAASLHFDAITPSVTEYWPQYWFHGGGSRTWALAKFRETDGLKMIVGNIRNSDAGSDGKISQIGLTAAQIQAGFIPGDMVVSNFNFDTTKVQVRPTYLQNCRLELVNPIGWGEALDQYCGPSGIRFELNDAAFTAEIKIPEGKEVDLKSFCNLQGTLVKRGAGTLVVPMFNTDVSGAIEVAEGTLDLRRGALISGEPLQLGSLKLAAGATFVVPEGGLTVVSLDAVAGSTITGGCLTVINRPVNALPVLTDGAGITFKFGYTAAEVFPASSLRLHFDASAASSITTNAAGGITRWDDLSGSGDYLVNNGRGSSAEWYATNRFNTANGLPMVDLGTLCWTNNGPGSATEKDRSLYLKKSDGTGYSRADADGGVLCFASCQTALCVVDSRHGGGPLIGQTGISGYPSYSPFPCGVRDLADWEAQQNSRFYIHTDVRSGEYWWGASWNDTQLANGTLIFRVNGVSRNPCTSKFTGGLEVVSYAAEKPLYGCFGLGCWGSTTAGYPRTANGLMYGEVVVFSNKLSLAEIELAERYLHYKWANADDPEFYNCVSVDAISLGAGSILAGVNGHAFVTRTLSGTGTVAGDLTLEDGGTISVAADASGAIGGTTVTGALMLGSSFGVAVGGLARPEVGDYRICSANTVEGTVNPALLTVTPFPGDPRPYKVLVDVEGVLLKVMQSGCCVIFR